MLRQPQLPSERMFACTEVRRSSILCKYNNSSDAWLHRRDSKFAKQISQIMILWLQSVYMRASEVCVRSRDLCIPWASRTLSCARLRVIPGWSQDTHAHLLRREQSISPFVPSHTPISSPCCVLSYNTAPRVAVDGRHRHKPRWRQRFNSHCSIQRSDSAKHTQVVMFERLNTHSSSVLLHAVQEAVTPVEVYVSTCMCRSFETLSELPVVSENWIIRWWHCL